MQSLFDFIDVLVRFLSYFPVNNSKFILFVLFLLAVLLVFAVFGKLAGACVVVLAVAGWFFLLKN